MMDEPPDESVAYWQARFGTKDMADAYAADIEKLAGLEGQPIPRTKVTRDRQGGWNVWIWE